MYKYKLLSLKIKYYQEFQLNVSMNTTVTAMAAFVTTDSDYNYKIYSTIFLKTTTP